MSAEINPKDLTASPQELDPTLAETKVLPRVEAPATESPLLLVFAGLMQDTLQEIQRLAHKHETQYWLDAHGTDAEKLAKIWAMTLDGLAPMRQADYDGYKAELQPIVEAINSRKSLMDVLTGAAAALAEIVNLCKVDNFAEINVQVVAENALAALAEVSK